MAWLYRVIVPVGDIEAAQAFYGALLEAPGERVSPGRHYFQCGQAILACYDPRADGDGPRPLPPNPEHVYLAFDDLDATVARARGLAWQALDAQVVTRPWGERSIYGRDPFGNPLCLVDVATVFLGSRTPGLHGRPAPRTR